MGLIPSFSQTHFRFRKDDGSETTATWRAAEDTNVSIALDEPFRLRIQIKETNGVAWTNYYFSLFYSLNSGGYGYIGISPVKFVASSNFADGDDCTALLTTNGTFVSDNNGMRETVESITNSGSANNYFECEFCLKLDSGKVDVGDTVDFRVYVGAEGGPLGSYTVTPRTTATSGAALPTKTDLQKLDHSFFGEPYVQVASKSGVELDGLDYSFFGEPFWGAEEGGTPPEPPSGIPKHYLYYARLRGN